MFFCDMWLQKNGLQKLCSVFEGEYIVSGLSDLHLHHILKRNTLRTVLLVIISH